MSRIGKKTIPVPAGVTITIDGQQITAKGPKGQLATVLVDQMEVSQSEDGIKLGPRGKSKTDRSMWGMSRTVVSNLVTGVNEGFVKKLQINGVGYRALLKGRTLVLNLGFSHDVEYAVPEGVDVACPVQTEIVVSGIDKQKVGQVAAEIRAYRPPEPYKGKGVKYSDEYIFRKEGKKK